MIGTQYTICKWLSAGAACAGAGGELEHLLAEKEAELKALASSLREHSSGSIPEDGGLDEASSALRVLRVWGRVMQFPVGNVLWALRAFISLMCRFRENT